MLSFGPPPTDSIGQPLLAGETVFADHLDPKALYYLPSALKILPGPGDGPDFFLLRYHGDSAEAQGGLLRFRLGFAPLAEARRQAAQSAGWTLREVNFNAARFRLRLRSLKQGASDETGDWHPATVGLELAAPVVGLNPLETQFLEALLADATNVIEVEVDLRYAGVVPGLPWLATADTAALFHFLSALLPAGSVTAEEITAAFLSLPETGPGPILWKSLAPAATQPPVAALLKELALRCIGRLFTCEPAADDFRPPRYRLRAPTSDDPASLSWDLLTARQQTRAWILSWSVGTMLQSLQTDEERRKCFPVVSKVSPFAQVDIHVINRVPYDPHFLRKAAVDLRYRGPAGVPESRSFTFDGTTDLQSFRVFFMAMTGNLDLAARFTATLAPPSGSDWPVIHQGPFTSVTGTVVEVNRAALGMDFVRLEATPEVFEKAASIEAAFYRADPGPDCPERPASAPLARFSLTAACPAAWIALNDISPAAALYTYTVAHCLADPQTPPHVLRCDQVVERRVRIAGYQLEVLDPERITIELDPQVSGRFAMVQVTLASSSADEQTFDLKAGQPVTWSFFRNSVFEPVLYRYRLAYVPMDKQGRTLPMISADWSQARESHLVLRPDPAEGEADP
jgi:hypothetical protein